MDNARIHHGEEILELAQNHSTFLTLYSTSCCSYSSLDVRIVFLPPYSPDFNPIEEAFLKIKSFIRCKQSYSSSSLRLLYPMHLAMGIITAEDAEGYFYHAGYL